MLLDRRCAHRTWSNAGTHRGTQACTARALEHSCIPCLFYRVSAMGTSIAQPGCRNDGAAAKQTDSGAMSQIHEVSAHGEVKAHFYGTDPTRNSRAESMQ